MSIFSKIGNAVSSVVKGAGQLAGNVVGVAAPIVGQLAHTVASNFPIVSNVYGAVTNLTGKDLTDVYRAVGDVASTVLKGGVGSIKDLPQVALNSLGGVVPTSDAAAAQQIHAAVQLNGALGQPPPDYNNTSVTFNSTPVVNGYALTPSLAESTFDTNPILQPVVVSSGEADKAVNSALEAQGVNPSVVAASLSPDGSKSTLGSILDLLGNTAQNVKDAFVPKPTDTTRTNWLFPALGIAAVGGLVYYFIQKK